MFILIYIYFILTHAMTIIINIYFQNKFNINKIQLNIHTFIIQ